MIWENCYRFRIWWPDPGHLQYIQDRNHLQRCGSGTIYSRSDQTAEKFRIQMRIRIILSQVFKRLNFCTKSCFLIFEAALVSRKLRKSSKLFILCLREFFFICFNSDPYTKGLSRFRNTDNMQIRTEPDICIASDWPVALGLAMEGRSAGFHRQIRRVTT